MELETRSKINSLFNDIEMLKKELKRDLELIKQKEDEILDSLKVGQEVLVYKNDEPYILTVNIKKSTRFNKADLANDVGVSQSQLNIPGVAELTEKGKITSSGLDRYWNEEEETKIKVKKATSTDVERLIQFNIDDFIG